MNYDWQQILCPDGKTRKGRVFVNTKEDSPKFLAQVSVKGKTITGWLNSNNDFVADPEGKNYKVFSPLYKTGKGYLKTPPEYIEEAPKLVETLTLLDLQKADGEIKLTADEVDRVCEVLSSFAQTLGVGMVCNKKRMVNALHRLHTLPGKLELASLQIRPLVAVDVTGDWAADLTELLAFINLHATKKSDEQHKNKP
jgi:hypothetical protein